MSAIAINPVHRAVRFYEAPIGKKAVMAVTGVILFGYVVAHLLGNLQIYSPNPEQINTYAAFLHNPQCRDAVGRAQRAAGGGDPAHHRLGAVLATLKRAARPVAYVKKDDVPATYAARTMIWSGPIVGGVRDLPRAAPDRGRGRAPARDRGPISRTCATT